MKTYEELITYLKMEEQPKQQESLRLWIEQDGLEKVNKEIEKIIKNALKRAGIK